MFTRREFLQTAAAVPALAQAQPKRIAIVTATYGPRHIGDRFLVGYPFAGEWHRPEMQVVSLYVERKEAGDLSGDRAKEFGLRAYPTIAEAVCCGGSKLAVDAVLIVGGYEFFEQVAKVFEADGRAVPVYIDTHPSYSFEKGVKLRDTARQLRVPLLAGSSMPFTWRLPELELPPECRIEDALMVGTGDGMEFHALEAMQCMLERRKGGEHGVKSVQIVEGNAVWQADWSKDLLGAALSRSDNLKGFSVTDGRTQDMVGTGVLPGLAKNASAYSIEYRDGLKATLLMLTEAVGDFTFAARLARKREIQSTQFLLTPEPNVTHSACLANQIEQMIRTGVSHYPVERTLLVAGIPESCQESRLKGHARIETPHLAIAYRAPR